MANSFGTDILIQSQDPKSAAKFYVDNLAFEISEERPNMGVCAGNTSTCLSSEVRRWGRYWKALRNHYLPAASCLSRLRSCSRSAFER
jgi:hypothetical protein